ncbi:MAG: hypothetical protein ABIO17_12285 [Pseudoxanthomonas sp.]
MIDELADQQAKTLAQWRWKLENMRAAGVRFYEVETAGDSLVCGHCRVLERSGPYAIDSGVIPNLSHCKRCRCALRSVA